MESLLKKSDHTAVCVSDDVYEMLMRSYAAAPKKKVWKETLCDKWGTKSRVRFEGRLVNWSLSHHKWVPIVPYGSFSDADQSRLAALGRRSLRERIRTQRSRRRWMRITLATITGITASECQSRCTDAREREVGSGKKKSPHSDAVFFVESVWPLRCRVCFLNEITLLKHLHNKKASPTLPLLRQAM